MDINNLLCGVECDCGRHHECAIKYVFSEDNAVLRLKELCSEYNKILIVADENTYEAAGEKTCSVISDKICGKVIFSGKTVLIPNEDAASRVNECLGDSDLIIGIGSGVIQDICKYISFNAEVPYFIVATAPSMDGYASTGAAMIMGGMKVTYSAGVPEAIIADTSILRNAPMEMIKAGYGDIIGKYSALNDWRISNIVNGEYLCPYIYELTMDMVRKTLPLADKLLRRDAESIGILMEALVTVGIAMSFAGNSRPASGSEHHLSHFFEITGIIEGSEYFSHGIDVLYSTFVTAKLRERLVNAEFPTCGYVTDRDSYVSEMKRVYREVSGGCIALQDKLNTYGTDRVTASLENEAELKKALSECPSSAEIENIIKNIGLDLKKFYDLYGEKKISDAVRYAKDLKDRYTVLWLYYDLFGTEDV